MTTKFCTFIPNVQVLLDPMLVACTVLKAVGRILPTSLVANILVPKKYFQQFLAK